jgi:hypothetical protein
MLLAFDNLVLKAAETLNINLFKTSFFKFITFVKI